MGFDDLSQIQTHQLQSKKDNIKNDPSPKWASLDSGTYSDNGQKAVFIDVTMKFLEKKKAINAIQIGRW